jgi:hypothetical protein
MIFAGLLIALLGFVLAVLSLGIATGAGARLAIVLAGIALSLFGILKVLNGHYVKNAIWRR